MLYKVIRLYKIRFKIKAIKLIRYYLINFYTILAYMPYNSLITIVFKR
jgi:hypothetical protein